MTAETTRADLLEALRELGLLFPEWRLGQTLANLTMAAGHAGSGAIWDLEDSEALTAARRLIERNRSRKEKELVNNSQPNGVATPVSANSKVAEEAPVNL